MIAQNCDFGASVTVIVYYRPQFYFRTTDVTGTVELPEGAEMVMPGNTSRSASS